MANIPATDIEKLLKRPDPLLSFRWGCTSEYLPFGLPSVYMESIDLPFLNIAVQEGRFAGGSYNYYPGFHNISQFNIVLYEDVQGTALNWVKQWKSRVKNFSTGAYFLPVNYKRDIEVGFFNPKGVIIKKFKLLGVWPAETGNQTLNYTESGRITVTQTFSVDSQEEDST